MTTDHDNLLGMLIPTGIRTDNVIGALGVFFQAQ